MNPKKIITFITATIMMCFFCIDDTSNIQYFKSKMVASADETYSGSCGENCTYSFDSSTGTLTISGTGTMEDYSYHLIDAPPWYNYREEIKKVIINNDITSIGSYVFLRCTSLTDITIPDSVTSICSCAFQNCTSLTDITVPNSVTSIGSYAFCECTSLTDITIPNNVTSISVGAFEGCTSLENITIPDNVTSIGRNAFYGCTLLTDITIPDSVTSISSYTFYECTSLTDITIPDRVTSISSYTFYECTSLTDITIPDSVTSISNYAFYRCKSLTDIIIPDNITSIGSNAFEKCALLSNITIPNSVTSIGASAFSDCTSLSSITIPNSVTSIGAGAFSWCTSLNSIIIPNSIKTIEDSTFWKCTSLESITISNSVTSIGTNAFDNCTSLTDVYYSGTKEEWNNINIESYSFNLINANIFFNTVLVSEVVTTTTEPPTTTTESPVTTTEPPTTTTEPSIETKDNTMIFGEDNWNILNQCSYFGQDGNDYYISKEDYTKLWSNLSNIEKVYIKDYKNSSWQGSCYGMAVTEILAKNGIFSTKDWFNSADCLSQLPTLDPEENSVEESLINYYQMLQLTIEVQQEITNTLCNKEQSEILGELIELSNNVQNGGSPVLLCYMGKDFGAHAVVSYGVTYGQYSIDNVLYNGRILILDPNYNLKFENNTCLYFNTIDDSWTIPIYDLKSNNGAELCLVTNNMDLLNNKGYFSNITNSFTNDNKYISILNMNNTNSNSYIDKVQNINGTWSINSNSSLDDIKTFYNFYSPNSTAEIYSKYMLTDFNSGYQISLNDYDYIDTDILYKNSLLQVEANNVNNIKFSPNGCIAIDGKNTDYSMNLTFNNEYCTLPWYDLNITGIKSNKVSVTQVDNGFILNGDNLIDVTISVYNDTVSTSVNFDTFNNSVLIYAIDDYTIGIATYTEDNQNFKVDTLIAKSIQYSFNNSDKQNSIKGDLNYDGKLSSLDLIIQKKIILGCIKLLDISIGDLNNDNLLNILDVIILKNNILNVEH